MPRSFRFDHFTALPHEAPTPPLHSSRPDSLPVEEGSDLHYGRRFSETAKLYHEKAEARAHEPPKMSMARPTRRSKARAAAHLPATHGVPIGALPVSSEPPPEFAQGAPLQGVFRQLFTEARRSFELIEHAVHDLKSAAGQLAHLPLEAIRLMSRHLDQLRHA